MTPSEMLAVRWRAQRFDADSYVMIEEGSDIVAGCESFELATHIVTRHNEWLAEQDAEQEAERLQQQRELESYP